jgi:hypothetical protein
LFCLYLLSDIEVFAMKEVMLQAKIREKKHFLGLKHSRNLPRIMSRIT